LLGKQQQLGSVIGEPLVPLLLPGIVSHEVISTSVSYSVARLIFCLTNFVLPNRSDGAGQALWGG
jgi:hypothetical protein